MSLQSRRTTDPELDAMCNVFEALSGLDAAARRRVLAWILTRFRIASLPEPAPAQGVANLVLLPLAGGQAVAHVHGEEPAPAAAPGLASVDVSDSIRRDSIVCLEDGRSFRSLKRHLKASHGMTVQQYRAKWGLPADYPLVAPELSEARSAMARDAGFGQQRLKSARSRTRRRAAKAAVGA